jgi:hypothetical protein
MDILTQVVQVLARYKRQKIDIIGNDESDSRYTELFNLIKDGKITTDKEVTQHFFGDKASPSDGKYRFFKSEFKDRLLNTLFFIDLDNPQFNEFQKAYYKAVHDWGAINILYRRGIVDAANNLAEKLLTDCIKYEITDLCVAILERLKSKYGLQVGDKKKYIHFKDLFWHYKEVWNSEHLAREAFEEIRLDYIKSTAFRPETSAKAELILKNLKELRDKTDSFQFVYFYYCVKEAVYSAKHDWKGLLPMCDEAIAYFNTKPFSVKTYIAIFINQKAIALFMLRRFEECRKVIEEALALQEEGDMNWFKTMEKKMLLLFHTGTYTEGYALYNQVRNIKEYKNLRGHNAEIWQLFEAYLYVGALVGKMPDIDRHAKNTFGNFRLSKFLNEIPTFSHDKKGMNIPVLVIQIVLMVLERHKGLVDRIETIEKYLVRNVPKSDSGNYRSNQFIKALVELPKADFKVKLIQRRTDKIIADMSSVPYDLVEAGYKLEVLPFEVLWQLILTQLGTKGFEMYRMKLVPRAAN